MKFPKVLIVLMMMTSLLNAAPASAAQLPLIKSFKFTPGDIDTSRSETKVQIEIVATHPNGIENTFIQVELTNSKNNSLAVQIYRTESPVNYALSEVTFRGDLLIPRDLTAGVYEFSASPIRNSYAAGYQYQTNKIYPSKIRNLVGGETGLLVRNNGSLNLIYETFIGPSYDSLRTFDFTDTNKYNSLNTPIWRVGDIFDPIKYFELKVTELSLKTSSQTPLICSSSGITMSFLSEGTCSFSIFTDGTKEYAERTINQSVLVKSKRIKPQLVVPVIANQKIQDLGKSIQINLLLAPNGGYVFPQSATPDICSASGLFVRLESGGKCTVTFQSKESADFLASDLYEVSFDVTRNPQTISFTPPATANLSAKSLALSATTSSAGAITFETTSIGICSITGATLNLLKSGNCSITATQAGTSTLAPISVTSTVMITGSLAPVNKTITCVMGKKSKKVSSTNPKCPRGYKLKK